MSSAEELTPNESQSASEAPADAAARPELEALRQQVLESLKVVHDPEIPVNIVDLGLVYDVNVREDGHVDITMTLTTMGCPVQDMIQTDAELAAMKVDGIVSAAVEFVWSPPWSLAKMTDDGRKQMRMFGFNV
ncbi:MAG: DUF59 domain-containing protein [Deinococcales bacterium]|nr:DUF59 domain-containing protein [Deinococcales bacterium]